MGRRAPRASVALPKAGEIVAVAFGGEHGAALRADDARRVGKALLPVVVVGVPFDVTSVPKVSPVAVASRVAPRCPQTCIRAAAHR